MGLSLGRPPAGRVVQADLARAGRVGSPAGRVVRAGESTGRVGAGVRRGRGGRGQLAEPPRSAGPGRVYGDRPGGGDRARARAGGRRCHSRAGPPACTGSTEKATTAAAAAAGLLPGPAPSSRVRSRNGLTRSDCPRRSTRSRCGTAAPRARSRPAPGRNRLASQRDRLAGAEEASPIRKERGERLASLRGEQKRAGYFLAQIAGGGDSLQLVQCPPNGARSKTRPLGTGGRGAARLPLPRARSRSRGTNCRVAAGTRRRVPAAPAPAPEQVPSGSGRREGRKKWRHSKKKLNNRCAYYYFVIKSFNKNYNGCTFRVYL